MWNTNYWQANYWHLDYWAEDATAPKISTPTGFRNLAGGLVFELVGKLITPLSRGL